EPDARREKVRKALKDRSSFVGSRGGSIAADLLLAELIPGLLCYFDRLLVDAVKSDPQCLAKAAIAKALRHLSYRDAAPYLRGLAHVQLEPTWGGRADSAGTLRGTCALALPNCQLDDLEILSHLADALADADKVVRIDAAMAIDQLNRPEGALLLRLKLLLGDSETDVLAQCFGSLLSLAPRESVGFVTRFLDSGVTTDLQSEAACALAACREPAAIALLADFWQVPTLSNELRRVVLINLGASALAEAAGFCCSLPGPVPAVLPRNAMVALATSGYRAATRQRLEAAIEARGNDALRAAFEACGLSS